MLETATNSRPERQSSNIDLNTPLPLPPIHLDNISLQDSVDSQLRSTSRPASAERAELEKLPSRPSELSLPNASGSHLSPPESGNVTPVTPTSPGREPRQKRPNPLVDLLATEKTYVELLSGIIRKVAAAWSRSNLPPKELDTAFRAVEGVYKANRSFLGELNEIGPTPSNAKDLGDLLMRWIENLSHPYTRYTSAYYTSFGEWEPIRRNERLPKVLADFSAANPPLAPDASTGSESVWSLDGLLALPRTRLKYYKRLYGRLLKSTSSGRSDYQLLLGANEKLDELIALLESRSILILGGDATPPRPLPATPPAQPLPVANTEVVVPPTTIEAPTAVTEAEPSRLSDQSSSQTSVTTGGERQSLETAHTSFAQSTSGNSVTDIERAVSTANTIDIFTMQPKQVKLSLNPPNLPFIRQLRLSCDVTIRFTPRCDGMERVHQRGHIFLMTDLFLVCERMESHSKETHHSDSLEWSLCYPPLAARHLSVISVDNQSVHILVLKKETLRFQVATPALKEQLIQEFEAAIHVGNSLVPAGKPPGKGLPSNPAAARTANQAPLLSQVSSPDGSPKHSFQSEAPPIMDISTAKGPSQPDPISSRDVSLSLEQNRDVSGRRNMISPPPSAPVPQQGLPQIMQPQPMPFPPNIPQMLEHRSLPHPGIQPNHLQAVPGGPVRFNSAPPPDSENLRPPPRGASMHNSEINGRQPRLVRDVNSAPTPDRPVYGGHQMLNGHGPPPHHEYFAQGGPRRPESRASTDPSPHGVLRKAPSARSLNSQGHNPYPGHPQVALREPSLHSQYSRMSTAPVLPSLAIRDANAYNSDTYGQNSPPPSPGRQGPVTSTISAQMKCKVFLKQQHAQWKSLGGAKLKLYHQHPTHVKQLVVEADTRDHPVIISTIILTDGVERVGKTGVAIEVSDKGQRTGIVYMIQLRNETSASGLFDQLLVGSDRTRQ